MRVLLVNDFPAELKRALLKRIYCFRGTAGCRKLAYAQDTSAEALFAGLDGHLSNNTIWEGRHFAHSRFRPNS